jgi:geranylgeranyl pyrophosphate synthase
LLALALQSLNEDDQKKLLYILDSGCEMSDSLRIANARELLEKGRVFEQAEKLIEKHRERAVDVAKSIEPEPLRRLMLYLIDTVLDQSAIAKEQQVHVPALHTIQIGLTPVR